MSVTVATALQLGLSLKRRPDGRWALLRHGKFITARPTLGKAFALLRVQAAALTEPMRPIGLA